MLGIYVHIPFCESKCHYCAFASFVKREEEQERYISSLIEEIENFSKDNNQEIDTIYIGGGTPSILSLQLMQKLIDCLKNSFVWNEKLEFTIEANPCSLTEEKLKLYKENGVNRISLGIQSLEDEKLKKIGRRHNKEKAIEKIKLASKYFENLSCDMLIGLPDMNENQFLSQIEWLATNDVKHISAYMLQVEEGTPLVKMIDYKEISLPDDDECVEVYTNMTKLLSGLGFKRYEVSNFAKEGYESRHNLKYWIGEEYMGFGLGAHSYFKGQRFANPSSFDDYYARKISYKEDITTQVKIEEHIMLGLRCYKGIKIDFLKTNGYDITQNKNYIDFKEKGILLEKDNKAYLNSDFYGVSNYIIASLIP